MLVSIPYCMSWMNQFMNDFLSVGAGKSLFMCKEAISSSRLFCSLPASILLFLSNSPVPFYHQTSFSPHFLSLHPSSSLFLCCSPSSLLSAALFHSPRGVDHVWMGLNDGWEGGCMQCGFTQARTCTAHRNTVLHERAHTEFTGGCVCVSLWVGVLRRMSHSLHETHTHSQSHMDEPACTHISNLNTRGFYLHAWLIVFMYHFNELGARVCSFDVFTLTVVHFCLLHWNCVRLCVLGVIRLFISVSHTQPEGYSSALHHLSSLSLPVDILSHLLTGSAHAPSPKIYIGCQVSQMMWPLPMTFMLSRRSG